jgi:2-oxoglutarate dehydrogenase E2 component (dihydrolipoamide succinyltransferase)
VDKTTPVLVPHESLNDSRVRVVAWRAGNGSRVEEGQCIAEVEGSKSVFEIYAPVSGFLQHNVSVDCEVEVGGTLCMISPVESPESNQAVFSPAEAIGGLVAHSVSDLMDSLTVQPAESLEVSSETRSNDPNYGPGRRVEVVPGDTLHDASLQPRSRFSAKALDLMQHYKIDRSTFSRNRLVRAQDVLATVKQERSQSDSSLKDAVGHNSYLPSANTSAEPQPTTGVSVRLEKLTHSKKTEIRHLASSHATTLPSVVTLAVPTRGLRGALEKSRLPISATAIFVFEVGRLLRDFPAFNAYYAQECMHVYEDINIGIAVDADHGLKVPVIRHADNKDVRQITDEIQAVLLNYIDDTLALESLSGGTFTITDLSSEGVTAFHPLINHGQAAILGIGAEVFAPGARDGFFNLILAFDHQLAEGRQAAKFLKALAQRLQAYEKALAYDRAESSSDELQCARCFTPVSRLQRLDARGREDHFLVQVVRSSGKMEYRCSLCVQGW